MNREIKFRGKSISTGKWIYAQIHGFGMDLFPVVVYADTISQYTGLYDKNGKEIYEGDILREQGTGKLVQVVYDAPLFVFKRNKFGYVFLNHPENFEVAGNAYDTPELLKGGRV